MKVIHLIARVNRGGTATWLNNLIPGLRNNGIQTFLLAGYCPENEIEDPCFKELDGIRIENLGRKVSLASDIQAFLEIRKQLKEIQPDILNTHTAKAGTLGRLAAASLLRNKPKVIHTYHGHVLTGYFGKIVSEIIRLIEKCLAYLTDLILVSSHKVQDELLLAGIGSKEKYRYISPGLGKPRELSKLDICKKLNINANDLHIGWMGRLTDIKRPELFLKLAESFPENKFLLAGEGELLTSLKNQAPQNVLFLGWQDASEFWSVCDIVILTSENEGKPLALVEAAQFGIPAIAEDVGGVSEVVIDKKTGFLTHSEGERNDALKELIDKYDLREELGNNAKLFANTEFSIEKFIARHIEVYQSSIS